MTSCVFSLFFLVSLCSSITADPSGIKVRITDKVQDVFKEATVLLLEELAKISFQDFSIVKGLTFTFTGCKFKYLRVTVDQVFITFQENSGLKFEIKDVDFAGELNLNGNQVDFEGKGLEAKVHVKLEQNHGKLTVTMPSCEIRAEGISVKFSSLLWKVVGLGIGLFQTYLINKICPSVREQAIPKLNNKLEEVTMVMKPFKDLNLIVDYSLSGGVAVTSNSLDVPFKGLVSMPDQAATAGSTGTDPVFIESNQMFYVGASELFFNSAIRSLYSAGALAKSANVRHPVGRVFLKTLQLFKQPKQLMNPLVSTLEATTAPTISISQRDGVTVKVKVKVEVAPVAPETPTDNKKLISVLVSVTCKVDIKAVIEENNLSFPPGTVRCTIDTGNNIQNYLVNAIIDFVANKVKDLLPGLWIPLPEEMSFIQAKINYHNGFLVVEGGLSLTQTMKDKLQETLRKRVGKKAES